MGDCKCWAARHLSPAHLAHPRFATADGNFHPFLKNRNYILLKPLELLELGVFYLHVYTGWGLGYDVHVFANMDDV